MVGVVATAGLPGTVVAMDVWVFSLSALWGVGWNGAEVGLKVVVLKVVGAVNDGDVEVTGDVVVEEEEPEDVVRPEPPELRGLNAVKFMLKVVPFWGDEVPLGEPCCLGTKDFEMFHDVLDVCWCWVDIFVVND